MPDSKSDAAPDKRPPEARGPGLWPCPFRNALAAFLAEWCDGERAEGEIMARELRYFADVIQRGEIWPCPSDKPTEDAIGTGLTTAQMRAAPEGAVFVWPWERSITYAQSLAVHLGRDDLKIVSSHVLSDGAKYFRGRRFPGIVLDHATSEMLTLEQWQEYWRALQVTKP